MVVFCINPFKDFKDSWNILWFAGARISIRDHVPPTQVVTVTFRGTFAFLANALRLADGGSKPRLVGLIYSK